jgi:hypothetical protein
MVERMNNVVKVNKFDLHEATPSTLAPIAQFEFSDFFVGIEIGRSEGGVVPQDGNTCLFRIACAHPNKYQYVCICEEPFTFMTDELIAEYYSPISGTDSSRQYAIGAKYVYLLWKKVFIEKQFCRAISRGVAPTREYVIISDYAHGITYTQEQQRLKDQNQPYDEVIDEDPKSPGQPTLEGRVLVEYRTEKYHIPPVWKEKFYRYKPLTTEVILPRRTGYDP